MAEGQDLYAQLNTLRLAEDLLRRTVRVADDPFLAITQSYRNKGHRFPVRPMRMEDLEDM